MSRLRSLWARLFGTRTVVIDREVAEEIRFHLAMREGSNRERGLDARTARMDARQRFGDPQRVRRAGREILAGAAPTTDGARPFETLLQDVRFGMRVLRRNPLTTAVAIGSLALGIGANTANFSFVYGVLFRDLPFENGDRAVFIDAWNPDRGDGDAPLAWGDLEDLRASDAFEGVEAFTQRNFTVTGGDQPERVSGAAVTPGLMTLLGVRPRLGRWFEPDEGAAAGFESVALISTGLWQRMFGGDAEIVGKSLQMNGRELVIVGVMPAGFRFPEVQDLWVPLGTDDPTGRTRRSVRAVGVLSPGVSLAQVTPRFAAASERAAELFPDTHRGWSLRVQPFRHGFIDASSRQILYLMFAAVGFVLLLACANVANLLLAHAGQRRRELTVRGALGASRGRLMRQMLTESIILGLAGAACGLLLAHVWVEALVRSIPEEFAFWIRVAVDGNAALYAGFVAVGTGILFGLLPAWQASSAGMDTSLRSAGRASDGSGGLRAGLVVVEVALSVVLLIAATLMVRSFLELQRADPGFDPAPLLSARIVLAGDQFDDPAARGEYFRQVVERLSALPGAAAATATGSIPADDGGADVQVRDGSGDRAEDEPLYAIAVPSSHRLFDTLGIRLIAGRDFTAGEVLAADSRVAVVGEGLARVLWPDGSALGRTLSIAGVEPPFRIVGVAPDLQYEEFGEENASARLQLHIPYGISGWRGMALLVRAEGDPAALVAPLRRELAALEATQAPYDILTMDERRAMTTWPQRLFGGSFGAFGAMALLLAVCGVYAVIAHSVSRRTREMGVRIALGARPGAVRRRVVLSALRLTATGVVLGLAAAWLFTRGLAGVLYGVQAGDPRIFVSVSAVLLAAAVAAAWLPARRAARVAPIEALRTD